ncbi:ATP-binding protein [soil metagenome]
MRRVGLRLRLTALAAITVGLALTIGAFFLVGVLRSRLDAAATTAAGLRASDVAALAEVEALPRRLALPGEESAFVQVVAADGRVVASTGNIEGEPAVASARPSGAQRLLLTTEIAPLDDNQPMRVAVLNATTGAGVVTVYAGESLRDVNDATAAVIGLLLPGVPLLALIVAAVTWWAVGRTLNPVREITQTMSEITTSDLHRRVPVPTVVDEIGNLAMTVNATLQRLDDSVETQRRFVADASHELRGPLAALRADLEISVTHPDQTTWTDVARDTLGDVERLQHLTDDLLLLARLDAQQHRPHQAIDLAAIAAEAIGTIRRNDVTIDTTGLDTPAHVRGDPEQLQRMMRNLVHNAEVHADTHIAVALARDSRVTQICVSDDGPGIPPDDRGRIFERFVRLDPARTRDTGGTGLGLAIVNDVVANHHGTITITDSQLGGTAFMIEIPSTA